VKDFPWCGLSVNFQDGIVVSHTKDSQFDDQYCATIDQLRSFLLNGELRYPKVIYTRLSGVGIKDDKRKWRTWRHDMLFLSLGVAGVEYVKTEGWKYVSEGKDVPVLIETVLGSVTIILQKNDSCFKKIGVLGEEEWFCAEKVYAIRLARGRKVLVPPGYYIVFVNNSLNPAAVSIIVNRKAKEVYAPFSQSRGAAYYAIKKNARQEWVPNPLYRNLRPLSRLRPDLVWNRIEREEVGDLLYDFLTRRVGIFRELLSMGLDWEGLLDF
jgi:oxalate decarboxylase/phosphoglucose isomerase-like protein (cupin superfamily)